MTSRQLLLSLLLSLVPAFAQTAQAPLPSLAQPATPAAPSMGQNLVYTSPSGLFSIPVPVLQELGGKIVDTDLYVNFEDDYTTHITVGVIQMDATFRWELATMEKKDFLVRAFGSMVLPQFKAASPTTKDDSVKLLPKFKDGALLVCTLHPGISHFSSRTALFGGGQDNPPTARRGTLMFTQGEYLVIISSELGERATERSAYTRTDAQEQELLKDRLVNLAKGLKLNVPANQPAKP